ncbi:MAG: insulinase family protein [Pseudomonadota bacterium]|nr:insulinase family protein [Pseudomonadota bacterium]
MHPRKLVATVVAAILVICAGMAGAASAIDIKEIRSPGGIQAWLVEQHSIPLIAMSFSFQDGSASDPGDKPGLTYLLSGMLDEGAGDLDSEAFRELRDRLSFRMSFESSADTFGGSFQTLSENRDPSFAALKIALLKPRFDAAPLERVRGQIILSIQDDEQNPEAIAFDRWRQTVFAGHPYARNSRGTIDGLRKASAEDLRARAGALFTRDKLLITVVGDIDAETLGRLLDETFGALPEKGSPGNIAKASVREGPLIEVIERDIPQSIIQFGHAGIPRDDPDFITAYVMNDILGGSGFGSRLTDEIREKRGLTYSVYTQLLPLEQGGLFLGGAATRNERVGETIELIRKELKRFAEEGPTPQELADARTYITGSYALRFTTSTRIAGQLLGIQEENLGIDYIKRRNSLVEAVTLEDVKRVAKRLIDADGLVITVVGKPEGIKF